MPWRFLAPLLIVLPVVEIVLLFRLGRLLGGAGTLLWLLATFMAGLWSHSAARRLRRTALAAGSEPGSRAVQGAAARALTRSLVLHLAGACLMLPGALSDAAGLLLALPPVQLRLLRALRDVALGNASRAREGGARRDPADEEPAPGAGPRSRSAAGAEGPGSTVIRDAEFEVLDEDRDSAP